MNFIGDGKSSTTKNWYIRNGALGRDVAYNVSVNFYTKLINLDYCADYVLAWSRGHSRDYNLVEVFTWINRVLKAAKK